MRSLRFRLLPLGLVAKRRGLTLIELAVCIGIVVLLMSLLLPAIGKIRDSARRTQCLNNVKNLSLAVLSSCESKQRFPAAAYWGGVEKNRPRPHHNWVVEILSFIDRHELAERWRHDEFLSAQLNQELAETHVNVLVCPGDFTANGRGDLSYVVNGGIGESSIVDSVQDCIVDPFNRELDLNGNGRTCTEQVEGDGDPSDREIFKRLGLFFNENVGFEGKSGYRGTRRFHSIRSVHDGLSNTLMICENIRTGYSPYFANSNWGSCKPRQTKFYFSHRICNNNVCSVGAVDLRNANSGEHAINFGLSMAEGDSPWPNSAHDDVVCVGFADGRVQFLHESVDGRVYYNQVTPDGMHLFGSPLDGDF